LHDEAAKQLAIASDYIQKCGYHRRDEELAELQAVLNGAREAISLPTTKSGSCLLLAARSVRRRSS
jgi:hypothetical protein